MAAYRTSRTFDIVFVIALAGLLGLAALNRLAVGDAVFFATHRPSTEVIQLAAKAGLSPAGSRLLERSNPQLDDAADIVTACGDHRLGCLNGRGKSFILADPFKPNQTVVTAAHEMLHLAYERLPQSKKDALAPLIDEAVRVNYLTISPELSAETDAADRRDEAHSLLGTEYRYLPAALESYYATYFIDRSKVLAAAASPN